MSVKAQWHGLAAVESSVDPFDRPAPATYSGPPMATIADKPIDLSTSEPVLRDRLSELLQREANLYDCGTSCQLKDAAEEQGCCLACPMSIADAELPDGDFSDEALVARHRQQRLCRLGREQQTIVAVLRAKQHHGG